MVRDHGHVLFLFVSLRHTCFVLAVSSGWCEQSGQGIVVARTGSLIRYEVKTPTLLYIMVRTHL